MDTKDFTSSIAIFGAEGKYIHISSISILESIVYPITNEFTHDLTSLIGPLRDAKKRADLTLISALKSMPKAILRDLSRNHKDGYDIHNAPLNPHVVLEETIFEASDDDCFSA